MYNYFSGLKNMMMISKRILYVLLLAILMSCQQSNKIDDGDKEAVVNQVTKMFTNYHKDIKAYGLEAEFKYLDESSDFFWIPPGYESALSYDSVKSILKLNHQAYQSVEFSWEELKIFPLSNEIANYSGIVKGTMTDTSGVINNMRIIESGSVIKRRDGWKLLSGQSAVL